MAKPPIRIKRSAVSGAIPTTAQLALGELAINTADGKVFLKKDDGIESIVEIGASASISSDAGIVKLDNIVFDGVETSFVLNLNGSPYTPSSITTLLVSVGGVIQEAGVAFTLSGSTINFTSAPPAGADFFALNLTTADPLIIDGGAAASSFGGSILTLDGGAA